MHAADLRPPELLPSRGVFDAAFDLRMRSDRTGAVVRFTRDGSFPTATHGELVSGPVSISRTTVIRAVTVFEGTVSPVVTGSYLVPSSTVHQDGTGLPGSWGVRKGRPVPAYYRMAPQAAIPGATTAEIRTALGALPSISLVLPPEDLWSGARGIYSNPQEIGDGWERAASLEILQAHGGEPVQLSCGLRMQGGWSRRPEESPKHSFRLVFRKRYGTARFRYPLFGTGADEFTTLILRGGNNNSWLHPATEERRRAEYLRDTWMRDSYAAMGHPASRGRFVHLYLNGLYWGIYQATERPDAHFAASRFGGTASDYDARNADKIIKGDDAAWKQLFAVADAGIRSEADYGRIGALLDLPAFIDFVLLNLYGANADWDRGSNWYAGRRRTPSGPWRFFEWDGERTLETVTDNRLGTDDDESPMRLFQRLRGYAPFVQAFAARAKIVLGEGGPLSPVPAAARYQKLADGLGPAIAAEAARWGAYRREVAPFRTGPYEIYTRETHWRPEVDRLLKDYFPVRTAEVTRQWREAGLLDLK